MKEKKQFLYMFMFNNPRKNQKWSVLKHYLPGALFAEAKNDYVEVKDESNGILQYVFLQPPPKNISYLGFLMSYRAQLGPKLKVIDCVFCL